MLTIKILSGLAFIGSVAWFIAQRDYEPAIAIVTSLSAFIAAWIGEKKMKRQTSQSQTVAENGIGIQAGQLTNNLTVHWALREEAAQRPVMSNVRISFYLLR